MKGLLMKRFDPRIVIGLLLVTGGVLALMQTMGYLQNVTDIFWGGFFAAIGLAFLFLLFSGQWWSAFPGFTLLGLGILILLPESLEDFGGAFLIGGIAISFWYTYLTSRNERWWAIIPACVLTALSVMIFVSQWYEDIGGAIFLGGIGLAFLVVFLTDRAERWWALIPAGVMATIAGVTIVAERFSEFQTAGFFFFGLALTFLLVALFTEMRWAFWPAFALGVMGLLGIASLLEFANYIWAVVMIAAGGFMLFRYFTNR
jgi:uncharacterized membrane protein